MTRRFAEDTKVPVGQTANEIKVRLRAAGADQIAVFEATEASAIMFKISGRMYRITVPIPAEDNHAQEERRAWRLLGLLIKSKLEAVREGATTVEREFLADAMLYNGQTVSEYVEPELRLAYEEGRMPKTLMLGGPST